MPGPRRRSQSAGARRRRSAGANEDAGRLGQSRLRRRDPIGLDLEQLVEVRHLPDPGVLDREVHAANRGEDGIDRDDADRHLLGVLRRPVADAGLNRDVHVDRPGVRVGVNSRSGFTISTSADSAISPAVTRPAPCLASRVTAGCKGTRPDLLHVQHDLGYVFLDRQ